MITKEQVETRIHHLLQQPLNSGDDLHKFLSEYEKFSRALAEEDATLYTRFSSNTLNPEIEKNLNKFYADIAPKREEGNFLINKKLKNSPVFEEFRDQFPIRAHQLDCDEKIFNEKNLPLIPKQKELTTRYHKITSAWKVTFRGEELGFTEVFNRLEDLSSQEAEELFVLFLKRMNQDANKLHELFSELFEVRKELAKNAGFNSFIEYTYTSLYRPYSPKENQAFHQEIKCFLLPVARKIKEFRKQKFELKTLKPWDDFRSLFKKDKLASSEGEIFEHARKIYSQLDKDLISLLETMIREKHFDLMVREGKARGGYCITFEEKELPYIFMNAEGSADDISVFHHEMGHAFHDYLTHKAQKYWDHRYTSEIAEVASMSMEFFALENYELNNKERDEFLLSKLESTLSFLAIMCCYDRFQLEVYTWDKYDAKRADALWMKLVEEFQGELGLEFKGIEHLMASYWQQKIHLFEIPFYYVEYGIAQIGALQFWLKYRKDPTGAFQDYKNTLKLGMSKNLKDLYKFAGIEWSMDEGACRKLGQRLETVVESLLENLDG